MNDSFVPVRKGFGLKQEIAGWLERDYSSPIVDHLKDQDYHLDLGQTGLLLAREFGFCYGVDRAIEYAYETIKRFPDKQVFVTNEIIHNPSVNRRLRALGVSFLTGPEAHPGGYEAVREGDVVIVPAFGVTTAEMDRLARTGVTLVDTTCGSVLNVWKNVERYARMGFTSVIHGKHQHEETLATCSRVTGIPGGHYIVVRDMREAELVARAIREAAPECLAGHFESAVSQDFDPALHLERIGLANQTTMLSSDSLAIAELLRRAMLDRYGEEEMAGRFRSFDTICSATQDRQDAVEELCQQGVDLMLIIGGYNSSNTNHLCEIASHWTRAYHIEDASCLLDARRIRHKPSRQRIQVEDEGWLPEGPVRVGVSAGASTPNSRVGEVLERVLELRGISVEQLLGGAS